LNRQDLAEWLTRSQDQLRQEISDWLPEQLSSPTLQRLLEGVVTETLVSIDSALGEAKGDESDATGI
jgi:hypothetical protein